ncbi:MAG: imidazole glycerol phosphate synthase subunit HisH [Peptococcaceae bacterium]|nr:imidazole glycerol phosphate synthase subunit HisH [Peptococcaceae bacterium]
MIAVIDYGAGNLFSVCNALRYLSLPHVVTKDAAEIAAADGILLPGVGAFADAMEKLTATGLVDLIKAEAERKPFLGVCLGLQMLFEEGREFGVTPGLGLLPGVVRPLDSHGQKLPHIGWNTAKIVNACPLTAGIADESYFYYVHSFCADTDARYISLATTYGETFPGMVWRDQIFGCQFHPEKSGDVGLQILKNFGRLVG